MNDHYTVVFDLAKSGYTTWWFPLSGLVMAAIAARTATRDSDDEGSSGRQQTIAGVVAGFALLWSLISLVTTWDEYSRYKNALSTGQYRSVVGVVRNFSPDPFMGKQESFDVQDVHFSYSESFVTSAFKTPHWLGSPIQNGVVLRVLYVPTPESQNAILRLEIQQP